MDNAPGFRYFGNELRLSLTFHGDRDVTAQLRRLEDELRARGLRVTPERRAILDFAYSRLGHFDAEELRAELARSGAAVSRATVYRTLGQLVELGLLRRHPGTDRSTFYESSFGREHHEHLVCVECGRILEFVQEDIERLQDEVCRQYHFTPLRHTLQIYGVCRSCRPAEAGDAQDEMAAPSGAER
jgi:Fur family ferric uptake transcriptional regulator